MEQHPDDWFTEQDTSPPGWFARGIAILLGLGVYGIIGLILYIYLR